MRARVVALAGFLAMLLPRPTAAAELSTFAGAQSDTRGQSFSYIGLDVTQPLEPPFAVAVRSVPSYLTYKFKSGDETVSASSLGASLVIGGKLRWPKISLGLFGGAELRDTDLDPDVRTAAMRGTTLSGVVQAEASGELPTRTHLAYFASFNGGDEFLYQKATARQQITNLDYSRPNTLLIGLEVVFGRNPDYEFFAIGPTLELYNVPGVFSIGVHGGYRHDATFGHGVYGGLAVWKRF